MPNPSYLKNGLRFTCKQCGNCCTGEPGTVYVSESEINAIAGRLGLDPTAFKEQYCYPFRDSFSLREHPDGACVFYKSVGGCLIYPVRPSQCRTYPFWIKIIRNEKNWNNEKKACPGIGVGKLFTEETITGVVNGRS
ncbi:MAG: YkgJ family cysteine cluster protein [Chitinivibrionales bacterium]|nr:YkgJ family cysteine cluster protein [Chitinivibrionales bacterium]